MKLKEVFAYKAVPGIGVGDANRPTPVSNIKVSPPLPDELCQDRTYCERKKKKKKKRKLREILRVHSRHGIAPNTFNVKDAEQDGFTEGKPVYIIKGPDNTELYCFIENDEIISHVMGIQFKGTDGKDYFVLKDTNTLPDYRRQGLATSLYSYIVNKKGIRLLSDDEQTQRGEDLWKGITKHFPERVKVIDVATGKQQKLKDMKYDGQVYIDGSKSTPASQQYRLVLEDNENPLGIPKEPYKVVMGSIIYTSPKNVGVFD